MEALLTLEFVAEAPGDYVAELQVASELNVAVLVCSAKVAAAEEAGPLQQAGLEHAADSR
jgi:CRISPR-associated protein Cas5t